MLSEAKTRTKHIDPALEAAGWGVVEHSRIVREFQITQGRLEGHGHRAKKEIADYVLIYRNRKLAVIEAKAWDKPLTEGVQQAKDYANKLGIRYTYASNGQGIYGIDMEEATEGDVAKYPSPEQLWKLTFSEQNVWRDRFAEVPFEDRGGTWTSRYYQDIAMERVLEAVADDKQRILLTLATGTGKTAIAFQIAWKLFKTRWNLSRDGKRLPRILFLADRNILANQAFNAFSAFPEDALVRISPQDIRKKGQVPKNGSIFFTIFQTFMSGPQGTPYFGGYPKDFFDFIVVDECHRGGANDESNWRGILDYFAPAVQLGLTATPRRTENADTYDYFGEPVYIYSLKEGINDGFLTPFRVREIETTIDDYVYADDDVVVEGVVDKDKRYEEDDFNSIIEIKERERFRVEKFMSMVDQNEKTLVFCANQAHALAVRDLINQNATSKYPNYCVRVTADEGERGDQYLREFQDNEKTLPTVLTTSQKLSTGVDALNVRNIVLMRSIKSLIEFKQIIGRGTRLYEGKDYFTIFDFVKAHHHFQDPEWDGEPIAPEKDTGDVTEIDRPPRKPKEKPEDDKPPRAKLKVKLADGKERAIQSIVSTSFWSADGKPMSATQFLESLFGALPEFFKNERELRQIWSSPETRKTLLEELGEKGFGRDHLTEMQRLISAEKCDLYDVLGYVRFATDPSTRETRASNARHELQGQYEDKQREFIEFVLAQYVKQGVDELATEKLTPLLRLKYNNAIADAIKDLGEPGEIRQLFVGFQRLLYEPRRAA